MSDVEIPSHSFKHLFQLARLNWSRIQVKHPEKPINLDLRLLDHERQLERGGVINEVIVSAEIDEDMIDELEQNRDKPFVLTFDLGDDQYYFEAKLKDMLVLFEEVPVLAFEWPQKLFKPSRRQAERIRNQLQDPLPPNGVYVRDISTKGVSFLTDRQLPLEVESKISDATLNIPILKQEGESLQIIYHQVPNLWLEVKRIQPGFSGFTLYGCTLNPLTVKLFVMIRRYQSIRKKEEAFFEKNHYYPESLLPEVQLNCAQLESGAVDLTEDK